MKNSTVEINDLKKEYADLCKQDETFSECQFDVFVRDTVRQNKAQYPNLYKALF